MLLHKMMIDFDAFVSSGTTQGKSLGNQKVLLLIYRVTLIFQTKLTYLTSNSQIKELISQPNMELYVKSTAWSDKFKSP